MSRTYTARRKLTPSEFDVFCRRYKINLQTHNVTVKEEKFSLFDKGDEWERANQYNPGGYLTLYRYKVTKVSRSFGSYLKNMVSPYILSPVWETINPDELVQKLPQ